MSLKTKDGYTVTTDIATKIVTEILAGKIKAGFMTPGKLFGPDLLLHTPSIELEEKARTLSSAQDSQWNQQSISTV